MSGRLRDVVLVSAGVSAGVLLRLPAPGEVGGWVRLLCVVAAYWTGLWACWQATREDSEG